MLFQIEIFYPFPFYTQISQKTPPLALLQQCSALEAEIDERKERIESKQQQLRELILQQVSLKSLVTRNKEAEERGLVPSQNSAIQLPFITVNTHKKTQINCSISDDK